MKRLFWQVFYILGILSLILLIISIIGIVFVMVAFGKTPDDVYRDLKTYCEKNIPRKYQILTRDDMYKVQSKSLFRWETHPNYMENKIHYNTLEDAKAAYTSIKKEHGYHSNDWSRVKLPCETKLWKELNQ